MDYKSNDTDTSFDRRRFFASENNFSSENASEKNISIEKSENVAGEAGEPVGEPVAVLDPIASPSPSPSPTRPRRPRDPFPESVLAAAIPCPACQCSLFWESIYFDGVLRCMKCDPLPGLPSFTFWGRKVARHTSVDVNSNGTTDPGVVELVEWEQRIIDGKGPQELARERAAWIRAKSIPTLPALGDGDCGGEGADSNGDPGCQDNYDRFVEFRTVDGRRGWALRGWDNPRSPNFNLRLVQAAGIGWEAADRILDDAQAELRVEMFG